MLRNTAIAFVALLAFQAPAVAALYQWVDEKGGLHFSDQPPPTNSTAAVKERAENPRIRAFPVPGHGKLLLEVPQTWDQEVRLLPNNLPSTIVLTPPQGDDFTVLITPLWSEKNEPGFNNSQFTQQIIAGRLKELQPTAVEKDVPLKEFKGKYNAGYYFQMTDKEPGESYPYLLQAGLGVGDLWLNITVLSRSKDSEGVREVLRALQGADQMRG